MSGGSSGGGGGGGTDSDGGESDEIASGGGNDGTGGSDGAGGNGTGSSGGGGVRTGSSGGGGGVMQCRWRIKLEDTEHHWLGWFDGLSKLFLSISVPKMLILAGVDRLDKDLTIGQMQGKSRSTLYGAA